MLHYRDLSSGREKSFVLELTSESLIMNHLCLIALLFVFRSRRLCDTAPRTQRTQVLPSVGTDPPNKLGEEEEERGENGMKRRGEKGKRKRGKRGEETKSRG